MEQKDFTKRFARRTSQTSAEAADQIDRVVNDLLRALRTGQPASIPGLGALKPFLSGRKRRMAKEGQ